MTCPEGGQLVIKALGGLPNFCQVCQLPTIFPRPDAHTGRSRIYKDKNYIFCSQGCEENFVKELEHYMGFQGFLERYNGFDLADVTLDMGFVRENGRTLIAQPVLEPKRMWTIDDIRRCQYEVEMPPPPPTSLEVPH